MVNHPHSRDPRARAVPAAARVVSPTKVGVFVLVAFALTLAFAGTAFAHFEQSATISCSTVTGSFTEFGSGDHPIVWHVSVGGGAFQTVATTEQPPGFVGTGTATGDVTALTKAIGPAGATVSYYATWPGGQSATTTTQLADCGSPPAPPPTTSPPTTTSPPPTTSPPAPPGPPGPPVIPIEVHPAPVAFAPPTATVAVPVVAVPATAG